MRLTNVGEPFFGRGVTRREPSYERAELLTFVGADWASHRSLDFFVGDVAVQAVS